MRKIVFPGEMLADRPFRTRGVYVRDGKTYAALIGLYDDETGNFIPLEGVYEPQVGDVLIGVVTDLKPNGYVVDTGLPHDAVISSRDLRGEVDVGDVIVAKVRSVDEVKNISLMDPVVLKGGKIIEISPVKVPRVIGKKGSMLAQIMDKTGSKIVVGKNGRIWISGGNEYLATKAILKIESEAHTSGLTDRIAKYLESNGDENE